MFFSSVPSKNSIAIELVFNRGGTLKPSLIHVHQVLPRPEEVLGIKRISLKRKSMVVKGAQVWDFDVLDFNDFFIMKSI